jgi:hypothetical protein
MTRRCAEFDDEMDQCLDCKCMYCIESPMRGGTCRLCPEFGCPEYPTKEEKE